MTTTTESKKALSHLLCQASKRASVEVLKQELERNHDSLLKGVLAYQKPTSASQQTFSKKGNMASKLSLFIVELSKFLQVEEETSRKLLQTYLSGEFRGTKDSLKKLVNDERCQKPLLCDIWQFYQAERLYILRILKEILTQLNLKTDSKHLPTLREAFKKLDEKKQLKDSLIDQLKSVIEAEPPNSVKNGKHFSKDLTSAWLHFNLREQCELLQVLLLYFYHEDTVSDSSDVTKLLQLFYQHGYGTKTANFHDSSVTTDKSLMESVGHLESILVVYLLDLPGLTSTNQSLADLDHHSIWRSTSVVQDLDRKIGSGLGNLKPHGPPLLAWMLSHYLSQDDLEKYKHLGEIALKLDVVNYLRQGLANDALKTNKVLAAITHGVVYSLISILVTAFEMESMGLAPAILETTLVLFKEEAIAGMIWKDGFDSSGLAGHFASIVSTFPASVRDPVRLYQALASASKQSAEHVYSHAYDRDVFGERVEAVPAHQVSMKSEGTYQLTTMRNTYDNLMVLPRGLVGSSNPNGQFYLWNINYNGFTLLFHEMDQLVNQVMQGSRNVQNDTLDNVTEIVGLLESLMKHATKKMTSLAPLVVRSCLVLVEKFVQVPHPPIKLLAACLRCLSNVQGDQDRAKVWSQLSDTRIFPYATRNFGNHDQEAVFDVNPGVVGTLLAQQECVLGSYSLTSAFLDLVLSVGKVHPDLVKASLLFVVQELLPSYQNWRFNVATEREVFGQKILQVCLDTFDVVKHILVKTAPNQTLIRIASTGDRVIQSFYEAQNTNESGVGVELAKLVHLSMELLDKLLNTAGATNTCLGREISSSSQPHFLLVVAHYIYHLQSGALPLASVKFLSSVASMFPMSMLACFGSDAEALRDILIDRLESKTEDVRLKIAILRLFGACVDSQPGFIQLLINVKSASSGEKSCLVSVMSLLKEIKTIPVEAELHVEVVKFVHNLWKHQRLLAMDHLKKQSDFWTLLTWPLFEEGRSSSKAAKLNSYILRVMTSEIFLYRCKPSGAKLDPELTSVLEKLFDEKQPHMKEWCELMKSSCEDAKVSADLDVSVLSSSEDDADSVFLLGSWKSFLVVLSKENPPIALSPKVCSRIMDSVLASLKIQMTSMEPHLQLTTSLSEIGLVLMQRWHTKCVGDSMEDWLSRMGSMLSEFSAVFDSLHPRSRLALLAMATSALKISAFKLTPDAEAKVLSTAWLPPTCGLIEKSLTSSGNEEDNRQVAILALGVMNRLMQKLVMDAKYWHEELHKRSMVLAVTSCAHHGIQSLKPDLVLACLSLLLTLAKSEEGCSAILTSDLGQLLWLPLCNIRMKLTKDWILVFNVGLRLALQILRVGKQHALDNSLNVVALLQDQLAAFLAGPRDSIEIERLDLTASASTFICQVSKYYKQWQLHHPESLNRSFQAMCGLLHTSICLLLRPSLLSMLIGQGNQQNAVKSDRDLQELQRVRRLSSMEPEPEANAELSAVQNRLLDIISSGLNMLISLSPDLVALVTDDIVDYACYKQLLQIGFSTPAFEQDESQCLSYGTVISICNWCTRSMTRTERSPSPGRSSHASGGSSHGGSATPVIMSDVSRLVLVLEQALTLMLAQALLSLSDERISSREKQLLRRELGAELGSVNEVMRRHIYRGTKSPSTVASSPTASGSASSSTSKLPKSDEQFMKFVSNIVQKVFK